MTTRKQKSKLLPVTVPNLLLVGWITLAICNVWGWGFVLAIWLVMLEDD